MSRNILFLLNPTSNEERAGRNWVRACEEFSFLPKEPVDITKVDNLAELIRVRDPDVIAVAGGDGTVNSVCREVLKLNKQPFLSIIPFGFGNALAYCLGVERLDKAISVLQKQPRIEKIDVLKTNIKDYGIGIFNIGVGFDARIVYNRMNYRYIGIRSYVISILRSYLLHPEKEMRFTIDHTVTLDATASSLVIANCPVLGQNFVISPGAKLNDGFLDCTLFSTKYAYLTNLRLKGFKHPLYSELGKVHFKAKHIRVEGEPFVQVDGDPAMLEGGLEVEVLPTQLTFLMNKREEIDLFYDPFN